jgi:hypothetical protein
MKLVSLAAAGVLCAAASQLAAQTPAPPSVLRIIREDVKQGKDSAHRNSENAFMLEAALSHYPAHVIGMTSITGTGQAWFLEGHDSFDAVEKTLNAFGATDSKFAQLDELDAEYRTSSRSWLAIYRADLSYRPEDWMQNFPKARFVGVDLMRCSSGHEADLEEVGHIIADAERKSMSDQPVVVYQVVSGLPSGTYLLFRPMASLKSLDSEPDRDRAMVQAMGDTTAKRFAKAVSDGIASSETMLFGLEPRMSYVSKEFIAADPDFWTPKTEAPKAKPRPKAAAKPANQ